jgi:hypothetical protein
MSTVELVPVEALFTPARMAVAGFLAGYSGRTPLVSGYTDRGPCSDATPNARSEPRRRPPHRHADRLVAGGTSFRVIGCAPCPALGTRRGPRPPGVSGRS